MKLDLKDKKILYELDRNARQPLSLIAKKVGLSRESVLYRQRKYIDNGIIRNYLSVINLAKLGFTHHKIYLKLHNISEQQEKEMISILVKNPFISWVASCDGGFSMIYAPKAKDILELNSIITDINNKFGRFIKSQDTATIIKAHHFYRDYLIGNKPTTERKIIWGGDTTESELDEINISILDAISENPRVSAVEIANKLKVSADSILQRIKKLEKSHILEHYMLWLRVEMAGRIYYKLLVTLHNFDENIEKKLIEYCLNNINIIYVVKCLGPWQFEMDIEVANIQEFRDLIRNFTNTFSEVVSEYTTLSIYDEYKYRFFEKEIMNPKFNKSGV